MFTPLNLPTANLKTRPNEIWDPLRRKFLKLTPEEWVRQNLIAYLTDHLNYPQGRMVSEYKVTYNGMNKRCDIAVFDSNLKAEVIIECKAPKIAITEDTFYQIAKYAHVLKAPFLILSNGLNHYCAVVEPSTGKINYLPEIPDYKLLENFIG